MAKRSGKVRREFRKLTSIGAQLAVVGGVLILLPTFISNPAMAKAFTSLSNLGWLTLILGGVVAVLGFKLSGKAETTAQSPSEKPNPKAPSPVRAEDRTVSERPPASPAARPPTPDQWSQAVFDAIEWRRFEAVVERLFQQAGFETKSQSHGADDGVDIWLHSRHLPGEPVSLVQCKHWQGKRVGVDKVRELRGVMAARNVKRGQFATTSTFTPEAIAFARENGIHLLDVEGLLALIAKRTRDEQAELLAVALEGDYWRPTCVNCGIKMVDRQPRNGGSPFWGCTGFPRCRTTMPMRAR